MSTPELTSSTPIKRRLFPDFTPTPPSNLSPNSNISKRPLSKTPQVPQNVILYLSHCFNTQFYLGYFIDVGLYYSASGKFGKRSCCHSSGFAQKR